jgi:hypothetical protein
VKLTDRLQKCRVLRIALRLVVIVGVVALRFRSYALAESDFLKGLDSRQIQETFGPPDKVAHGSPGNERWHYGQSVVFLNDGKVVAWSDRGDLVTRRKQIELQRNIKRDEVDKKSDWVNTWTPNDTADVDEILDDLMK